MAQLYFLIQWALFDNIFKFWLMSYLITTNFSMVPCFIGAKSWEKILGGKVMQSSDNWLKVWLMYSFRHSRSKKNFQSVFEVLCWTTFSTFCQYLWLIRVIVSMGAVGAVAPLVFESVGASTHGEFCHKSFNFHEKRHENFSNIVIPWQELKQSTHSLKLLMRTLLILQKSTLQKCGLI